MSSWLIYLSYNKYYTFFIKNAIVKNTMNNNEYEQKIIIPHDTTLSEILEENRYIL